MLIDCIALTDNPRASSRCCTSAHSAPLCTFTIFRVASTVMRFRPRMFSTRESFSPAGAAANCTTLRMPTIREAAIAEASDTTNVRRLRLNGRVEEAWPSMATKLTTIQKCAWGFAALFLGVYLLDYVPGIMDANGLMFGLFHMTRIVDVGHLAAGALGVIGALTSARGARIYFCVLGTWYLIDVVVYFYSHVCQIS